MSTIKREMTPELKEKLKGLLPTSNMVGIPFTPELFKKDESLKPFAPVYSQRGFLESERIQIETLEGNLDLENVTNSDLIKLNNDLIEIGRKTIIGIDIYDIGTEDNIVFQKDEEGFLSKEIWQTIPKTQKLEIYKNACIISGLKERETIQEEKERLEYRLKQINESLGLNSKEVNEIQEGLDS